VALRTYQAFSMGDVLARIKSDMGESAVIVHTRSFKRGGIFGIGAKTVYEVTANDSPPPTTMTDDTRNQHLTTSSHVSTRKRSSRFNRDNGTVESQSKPRNRTNQVVAPDQTQDKAVIAIAEALLKKRSSASRQTPPATTHTAPVLAHQNTIKKNTPHTPPPNVQLDQPHSSFNFSPRINRANRSA